LPAKSKPLGFACPECKLEYGSVVIEDQKDWWRGKKRLRSKGKTHESYKSKQLNELKPAEIALKNIIESLSYKFLVRSFDSPEFSKMLSLIPDTEKQRKVKEIAKDFATSVHTVESLKQKEIKEEESKYSKWDVVEELDTNSREYRLFKQVRNMTRATNILKSQDRNYDREEKEEKTGKVVVTWNPIKEIKIYRRAGDPLRHIDLKSILDFIESKVTVRYPEIMAKYLSAENRSVMKKAFDVINRYREQFSNKNYRYLWFEWFWIVKYSDFETPKIASNMLAVLDDEKDTISAKQIKNRKEQTLNFLEDFFCYSRVFFLFLFKILQIVEKDDFLKNEYKDLIKKSRDKNESSIDNIVKRHHLTNDAPSNNLSIRYDVEDLGIVRTKPKRIRIYHYNPNYRKEMAEYHKRPKDKPWNRKRCGPFKLSELTYAIIRQLKIEKTQS
jgi:hypothetical protein